MIRGLREISAIATLLIVNAFFGISSEETVFIFPAFGAEVFKIINFYALILGITGLAFGLVVLYRYINRVPLELPQIPSTPAVVLNYMIFLVISYFVLIWFFVGSLDLSNFPIPSLRDLIEQSIIAMDENTIAFIFIASIYPIGNGVGNLLSRPLKVFSFGQYSLNFNPPNWNRFKFGIYGIILITLLHAGRYSFQVSNFNEFYIAMLIAGVMFAFIWLIMQTFGYGACVAFHTVWNVVLINTRGSVY